MKRQTVHVKPVSAIAMEAIAERHGISFYELISITRDYLDLVGVDLDDSGDEEL